MLIHAGTEITLGFVALGIAILLLFIALLISILADLSTPAP